MFNSIKEAGGFNELTIQTPLGSMLAIADDSSLYSLEFISSENSNKRRNKQQLKILPGLNKTLISIKGELNEYFAGKLKKFKTPIHFIGTEFQKSVWQALLDIPYGETRSYLEQATIIGAPSAYRAVANANGANPIAIIVPCHRIINSNRGIGGYVYGVSLKLRLLEHEAQYHTSLGTNPISTLP